MNRRRKKFGIGNLIILLIILSIIGEELFANLLAMGFFAVGFVVFVLIVRKLLRVLGLIDTPVKKEEKPTKNPYSVNYNKEAAEGYNKKTVEIVVDGSTVKEEKVQEKKEEPEIKKPEPPKHKTTGDPEIDKMIVDKDLAIEEMKRLDDAIEDEKLSNQIVHLEEITSKIVDYIIDHPKKKTQVAKFFSYYLPTTLKLLNAYDRMDDAGISGANIDGTKEQVDAMMDTALAAFDKQLDALFADEALDVSTDIKVMENMLKAEGLTEDEITLKL